MATKTRTKTFKLDLACGQNKAEGFTGVDIWAGADIVHDLTQYPWPFENNSVREAHCSHYVEHVPYDVLRDGQLTDGLCAFMNELHRVLKKGAKATIIHPFLKSARAFQDPTHRRFIPEATWYYFNREWREANRLDHYPITANFTVQQVGWTWLDLDVPKRAEEYQQRSITRDWEIVADLYVELVAIK